MRKNIKLLKEVRNHHTLNCPITCLLVYGLTKVWWCIISDILDEGSSDSGEEGDGSDDDDDDEEDENEEEGDGETNTLICWGFLA